jgi:hypothetical protein
VLVGLADLEVLEIEPATFMPLLGGLHRRLQDRVVKLSFTIIAACSAQLRRPSKGLTVRALARNQVARKRRRRHAGPAP